jgi:hypothetical protein
VTFYCELPNDKNIIRTPTGTRIAGRYVIVNSFFLPSHIKYVAARIIHRHLKVDPNIYTWTKNGEHTAGRELTQEEQKELVFQILKSETW